MGLRFTIATVVWLLTSSVLAGPFELSYSGRLTESSGKPLSGTVSLRVGFFRSALGNDQVAVVLSDFANISLNEGVFQITLNFSASDFHKIFNGTDDAYIQIHELTHDIIYPRQKFSAIPYALKVPVDGDVISYNNDGKLTLARGSTGQFLKTGANGEIEWETISGGGDMLSSNNLADLADPAAARANLGLGAAAIKAVGVGANDVATGDHSHGDATTSASGFMSSTDKSKLDNLPSLGNAATKNVGTGANDVAVGNHGHSDATTTTPGFMSAADKVRLNAAVVTTDTGSVTSTMINDGTIVNNDISDTAAIAVAKISGLGSLATKSEITLSELSATICDANEVLRMNSNGTALACAAAGGSFGSISSNYTVTVSDNDKLLAVSGSTYVTLPLASTIPAGFRVLVKRIGTDFVNVRPTGADTIEGQNTGFLFTEKNRLLTFVNTGSAWIIGSPYSPNDFPRISSLVEVCGPPGDDCYSDTAAKNLGFALTPDGKVLEYVQNIHGFSIWKEVGGTRILRPNGLDSWALKLNDTGKGFSAVEFASYDSISGRVCPPNVYIDDSNRFSTGNCLYYTAEPSQALNANGTDLINGMDVWSTEKWYAGNVQACSSKGMRLPTIFETDAASIAETYYPTADGGPVFAQADGIPSRINWTWTASTYTNGTSLYWVWSGTTVGHYNYVNGTGALRCVLP